MCQYCKKPNKTIVTLLSGVSAFIGAGRLFLRLDDKEGDRTITASVYIKYCPMCGRKLTEVK